MDTHVRKVLQQCRATCTVAVYSYLHMHMHVCMYEHVCMYVHVIVVSRFYSVLREGCMYFQGQSPRKYIQHEGGTIPCTVKTMTCTDHRYTRGLSLVYLCTDRLYKANRQISASARMITL